jgi:CRISPR-associated protein Cas2
MSRRRFLVTYDVSDPKRVKVAHKAMSDFGRHVQFSVFLCELDSREFLQMEHRLQKILNLRQDQALIFDLGLASNDRDDLIQSIGRDYEEPAKVFIA